MFARIHLVMMLNNVSANNSFQFVFFVNNLPDIHQITLENAETKFHINLK